MTTKYHPAERVNVYPGSFVPAIDSITFKNIYVHNESIINYPGVNVLDKGSEIHVELMIPGVKREEFLIEGRNNVLDVTVFHECRKETGTSYDTREFNNCKFHRKIELPEKADLSFVCATYDDGILKIQIPKSDNILKNLKTIIAVY